MAIYQTDRVRFNGIAADLAYSKLGAVNVAILAYGMPGGPIARDHQAVANLVRRGYLVIMPFYIGTYDSDGFCDFSNSAETIVKAIDFARRGSAFGVYANSKMAWRAKRLILIGGSYGGSVVLVAGAKRRVDKIVSIAPPTDYAKQGHDVYEEEDMAYDYRIIKHGYPHTWRFSSKKPWLDLDKGRADLDAVDYVKELKGKNVVLVHGTKDKSVNVNRSIELFDMIKGGRGRKRLILLKGKGHVGVKVLKSQKLLDKVLRA